MRRAVFGKNEKSNEAEYQIAIFVGIEDEDPMSYAICVIPASVNDVIN